MIPKAMGRSYIEPSFFHICRGKVYGYSAHRIIKAAVFYGGAHPLLGFAHGSVRQSHYLAGRQRCRNVYLHRNHKTLKTGQAEAFYL